jgi:hypothetical protein
MPFSDFVVTMEWEFVAPTTSIANIFHVTARNRDCCNVGDRVPAVWMYAGDVRKYHVVNSAPTNGNWVCDVDTGVTHVPGERTKLQIVNDLHQDGKAMKIVVLENDVVMRTCTWSDFREFDGRGATYDRAVIYASDPWYTAAGIKDFSFQIETFEGQDVYWSQNIPDSSLLMAQEIFGNLTPNRNLGQHDIPFGDFAITLEWDLVSAPTDIANILHITNQNRDCCDWGNRIPAIWFLPGDVRKYHIVNSLPYNGNWNCDVDTGLPYAPGEGTTLTIVNDLHQNGNEVRLVIIENGQILRTCTSDNSAMRDYDGRGEAWRNSLIYAADRWYQTAGISDLSVQIETFEGRDLYW